MEAQLLDKLKNVELRDLTKQVFIKNVLINVRGSIVGYEGAVITKNSNGDETTQSFCSWDLDGVAYSQDRGLDLVIRQKLV